MWGLHRLATIHHLSLEVQNIMQRNVNSLECQGELDCVHIEGSELDFAHVERRGELDCVHVERRGELDCAHVEGRGELQKSQEREECFVKCFT